MSRFINADMFKQTLENRQSMYDEDEDDMALNECACIIKILDALPTADVVDVVRCKDCKFRNTSDCAMRYECDNCSVQYSWENNNDYCSYGERREQ